MLTREKLRKTLLYFLSGQMIQEVVDGECVEGYLYVNCSSPVRIHDSKTSMFYGEHAGGQRGSGEECYIVFHVPDVQYTFIKDRNQKTRISFAIHIVAQNPEGAARSDLLDTVERRIYARLFSEFQVEYNGDAVWPLAKYARDGRVEVAASDDVEANQIRTVRTLQFTFETEECNVVPECATTPFCYQLEVEDLCP